MCLVMHACEFQSYTDNINCVWIDACSLTLRLYTTFDIIIEYMYGNRHPALRYISTCTSTTRTCSKCMYFILQTVVPDTEPLVELGTGPQCLGLPPAQWIWGQHTRSRWEVNYRNEN